MNDNGNTIPDAGEHVTLPAHSPLVEGDPAAPLNPDKAVGSTEQSAPGVVPPTGETEAVAPSPEASGQTPDADPAKPKDAVDLFPHGTLGIK